MKVCTFTGHRPHKLPWKFNESDERCQKLKRDLAKAILSAIADGYDHFICGGALGVDMWAAEIVLKYKAIFGLSLEIAQPFAGFNENEADELGKRQQYILANADKVTVVSSADLNDAYRKRNQYMIEQSSRLIAVFNAKQIYSGTAQTVRMAKKANLEIVHLEINTAGIC